MKTPFLALVMTTVLGSLAAHAQTTLLSDTFDRGTSGTPANLNATSPDASAGGYKWNAITGNANATAQTNGSTLLMDSTNYTGQNDFIQLASGLTANTTYTLTVNMPQFTPNGGDSWFNISLSNNPGNANGGSIGGLFVRSAGRGSWNYNDGVGTDNSADLTNQSAVNSSSGTKLVITYDTGSGVENFYIGTLTPTGTPDLTYTYTSTPTGALYLDMNTFNGDTSTPLDANPENIDLTSVQVTALADTPEPSTWALVGVSLLVFGWKARHRLVA